MSTPVPRPYVPEQITIHLGPPDSSAQNVTVSFPDYIKNVASSEIYPTWDRSAVLANIYAQISFALNRVYLEYYPSRGYGFNITNSTAYDQSFHYGRNIFQNISELVDEVFNNYIRRQGVLEPLSARYCNGTTVTCNGLSQWGSQSLATQGYDAISILRNYYGNDIELVVNAPVSNIRQSYPGYPISRGSTGPAVTVIQASLNRVSQNYPAIPKVNPVDGVFGPQTEEAVRAFQRIFNLAVDGIVGKATWYKLVMLYVAFARLSELESEGQRIFGIPLEISGGVSGIPTAPAQTAGPRAVPVFAQARRNPEASLPPPLGPGDSGQEVRIVQFFLAMIGEFYSSVPPLDITGVYDEQTVRAVTAVQRSSGLPLTGEVDQATWDQIYNMYQGIILTVFTRSYSDFMQTVPFPGMVLKQGSRGPEVRTLQQYLNNISILYHTIPPVQVTGIYGPATAESVRRYQVQFQLPPTGQVDEATWNSIANTYRNVISSEASLPRQNPGFVLKSGMQDKM